ncbi:Aldehyde dehydrogenase family 1 member A3 [Penicillium rolfsii]|nr:Aldehyde dehydrogenase family 1 member A3 [Penicillium rolfsii]
MSSDEMTRGMKFAHVVDGKLLEGKRFDCCKDPRSSEPLWDVPVAGEEELQIAVTAAQNAFPLWSKKPVAERQDILRQLAAMLREERKLMSMVVSKETGKSDFMSGLEVDHSIAFLEFNASQEITDEIVHEDDTMKIVQTHSPLGIVAAICPWNFPLVLATAKVAAALLTGNCIIVKPSPFTPYSILKFAEKATKIVPAGVFQALNGDNALGASMSTHPGIQKISFTGSTKTGKKIMEAASGTLKRITLELGGNDATIVCPDVDLSKVASEVVNGCLFNAGQMCVATKRVYIHESIYREFMERVVEAAKAFTEQPSTAPPIFGPIQNYMQYAIVQDLIEDCKATGCKIVAGQNQSANGLFIEPTIVDNPPDDSRIVKEEQFGPIIPLMSWKDEEEVIRRVNDTDAGLGACVWAKDSTRALSIGRKLEAGSIWINSYEKPNPAGYFSGHKQSGIGGEWGRQGLLSYCNTQSIHIFK